MKKPVTSDLVLTHHFLIDGSKMFGGVGTEGYAKVTCEKKPNTTIQDFLSQASLVSVIPMVASKCEVGTGQVYLISKEMYEENADESEEL